MDNIQIGMYLLSAGNFIILFGTLLLIRTVLKDRNVLKGYDMIGAILTLGGLSCFALGYVFFWNWMSLVLCLPTFLYWGLVCFYTIRRKIGCQK